MSLYEFACKVLDTPSSALSGREREMVGVSYGRPAAHYKAVAVMDQGRLLEDEDSSRDPQSNDRLQSGPCPTHHRDITICGAPHTINIRANKDLFFLQIWNIAFRLYLAHI